MEHAQQIANHESPHTTKPHDRTSDAISLDDIGRILIQVGVAEGMTSCARSVAKGRSI